MQYYEELLEALSSYFKEENWKKMFLDGGCYWFANILHQRIRDSFFMINRAEEHCGLYFEHSLYDVSGKISQKNFKTAGEREISFMEKNYVPRFDTEELERYLCGCHLL